MSGRPGSSDRSERDCRGVRIVAITVPTGGGWCVECPGLARDRLTMTYCCGILVRDGLVMVADTRTNAGLDNISVFRKLHVFGIPGERILALASSGNLS